MKTTFKTALSAFIFGVLSATLVQAQPFEQPQSVNASTLAGIKPSGSNYRIVDPVSSDGYLRIYELETPDGQFRLEGDAFLRLRLRELGAIEALDRMQETKTFQDGFKQAAEAPVDFAESAVTNPGETAKRTVTGIGRLFGRVASGVRNVGKGPDSAAESLLGVSSAKREIAVSLGVDPYSDFEPLAKRLDHVAKVSAMGGLTVKALFSLVPGGADMAVSGVSSASSVADLVKDRTPSELREINRSNLVRAVGKSPSINHFLDNRLYTPTDQTVVAAALFQMRKVRNVDAFLVGVAGVSERAQAVFMIERAALLARHHVNTEPIAEFVAIAGIPFCVTQSGNLLGLFPLDTLAWTEQLAQTVRRIDGERKNLGNSGGVQVMITGDVTPLAKAGLEKAGWSVSDTVSLIGIK